MLRNQRSHYDDPPYDLDGHDPHAGEDGADLDPFSFPPSVQARLDQARTILRQGAPAPETGEALSAAMSELARTSPELFALGLAARAGVRRLTVREAETDTVTVRTERFTLGVRTGHDVQTISKRRAKERSYEID